MEMTKETRDALVTTLYERCANGEISRDQRELLLQKANSMFIATEAKKKDCDDIDCEEPKKKEKKLSPKEKYDIFKKEVYKRCADKEFDEDVREALLDKAKEEFLGDDDDDTKEDKKEKDSDAEDVAEEEAAESEEDAE